MAPTGCWLEEAARVRTARSLEERLAGLHLADEGVRNLTHFKRTIRLHRFTFNNKVVMGLVVEQERRESDSPGLPPCLGGEADEVRRRRLVDITLRTMALLHRNQQLQRRLTNLQLQTRAFVNTFLPQPRPAPDS